MVPFTSGTVNADGDSNRLKRPEAEEIAKAEKDIKDIFGAEINKAKHRWVAGR
jgi:hypothetical protein